MVLMRTAKFKGVDPITLNMGEEYLYMTIMYSSSFEIHYMYSKNR